jgi:hypothetical protein
MDKQIMAYTYNDVPLDSKKEKATDCPYNLNESQNDHAE